MVLDMVGVMVLDLVSVLDIVSVLVEVRVLVYVRVTGGVRVMVGVVVMVEVRVVVGVSGDRTAHASNPFESLFVPSGQVVFFQIMGAK